MWGKFEQYKEQLRKQYSESNWQAGMPYDELKKEVTRIIEEYEKISVARARAEAIAFILRNAQLSYCKGDLFIDRINHGTIMVDYIISKINQSKKEHPEVSVLGNEAWGIEAYRSSMDFSHIGPDWDFLMENGAVGVLSKLRENKSKHMGDPKKEEYYDNSILVYEAMIDLFARMAELCEKEGDEKALFVAANLRELCVSAPRTLAQAMQFSVIYYHLQTDIERCNIRSLGGLDHLFGPLYLSDMESGRFKEEQLRELTACFLWRFGGMNICANMPFYICGMDRDGNDATNEYTFVILEEYRKLDIYDPKIHVICHRGIDPDVITLILEMIREGKNSFLFAGAETMSKSLETIGVSPEDAKRIILYGCYEAAAEGTELPCTTAGNVNFVKALELAINNGTDPLSGKEFGLKTGEDFLSFDSFYDAVKEQLKFLTESCMKIIATYETNYQNVCSAPFMSPTYKNSMETGVDLYSGGAKYNNTSIVGAGPATLVDSLMMIKKFVYDEKVISFAELRECLKNDWEGYEKLRLRILKSPEKYGNGCKEADDMAVEIFDFFAEVVNNRPNGRGGVFRSGMFSIDIIYSLGEHAMATPDGRKAGEPISKNNAPTVGQDRNGVTAYLDGLLKLDATKFPDALIADVVLHHSAVKGDDGLAAFRGLLNTFLKKGGFAIHFNVLNPDVLREAQVNPEKHKSLQIRLCGWNVYFVNLHEHEQNNFITQSTNGL